MSTLRFATTRPTWGIWNRRGRCISSRRSVPKSTILPISFDHTESAGEQTYWFAAYEAGKKQLRGLDALPQLAAGFGLTVERLPQPPEALAAETADWDWRDGRTYDWYVVQGGRDGIGFQYAVIVYIGLHLCKVAGRRFKGLHSTARETKTRFRKTLAKARAAFDAECREAEATRRNNPGAEPAFAEIVNLVSEPRNVTGNLTASS